MKGRARANVQKAKFSFESNYGASSRSSKRVTWWKSNSKLIKSPPTCFIQITEDYLVKALNSIATSAAEFNSQRLLPSYKELSASHLLHYWTRACKLSDYSKAFEFRLTCEVWRHASQNAVRLCFQNFCGAFRNCFGFCGESAKAWNS